MSDQASRNGEPREAGGGNPTLVDRVYLELKRRIKQNIYPPGFIALEGELADELDVSRTPVREALIRLQQEGYIEIRRRHGIRVLSLSAEDMAELYEVISGLESVAVLLLTQRGATVEQEAVLLRTVARMQTAIDLDDLDAWAEADAVFHRSLFEFCANGRLRELGLWHLERTERARNFTLRLRRTPSVSTADHRDLTSLILAGKAELAQAAVVRHRMHAMQELVAIIRRHQIGGI